MDEQILDAVVDAVAKNEPVTPAELPEFLEAEINEKTADHYLLVAEDRGRVLEVNDKYWVMRIGPYSDLPE